MLTMQGTGGEGQEGAQFTSSPASASSPPFRLISVDKKNKKAALQVFLVPTAQGTLWSWVQLT